MKLEMKRRPVSPRSSQQDAVLDNALGLGNRPYALISIEQRQLIVETEYLRMRALVRSLMDEAVTPR
jgi:hypothetical protein